MIEGFWGPCFVHCYFIKDKAKWFSEMLVSCSVVFVSPDGRAELFNLVSPTRQEILRLAGCLYLSMDPSEAHNFQAVLSCPNWVLFPGGWCWVRQVSFRSCQCCIYCRAFQLFISSFSLKVFFNIWLVTLEEQWFPSAWVTSVFCWIEDFYFWSCFIQINGRRMKWLINLFSWGLLMQGKDFRNLREGNSIFHVYL